ncbi:hypothetical protein GOP47_0004749 [Adiantum capillus-veneris]|uniref:Uncharacterized protein n=1 Tax=Adiantum capillus-veneris TaxID=13818 RepID=A0A9D4ZNH7_ADICA|nr:hypothetical protein GOP47_0004749 [Adiantum capillus-veneris]
MQVFSCRNGFVCIHFDRASCSVDQLSPGRRVMLPLQLLISQIGNASSFKGEESLSSLRIGHRGMATFCIYLC